jgi:translation initiation factor IF-2
MSWIDILKDDETRRPAFMDRAKRALEEERAQKNTREIKVTGKTLDALEALYYELQQLDVDSRVPEKIEEALSLVGREV